MHFKKIWELKIKSYLKNKSGIPVYFRKASDSQLLIYFIRTVNIYLKVLQILFVLGNVYIEH